GTVALRDRLRLPRAADQLFRQRQAVHRHRRRAPLDGHQAGGAEKRQYLLDGIRVYAVKRAGRIGEASIRLSESAHRPRPAASADAPCGMKTMMAGFHERADFPEVWEGVCTGFLLRSR